MFGQPILIFFPGPKSLEELPKVDGQRLPSIKKKKKPKPKPKL
jgi:hypothetical protein